jgi:hypothetical protein
MTAAVLRGPVRTNANIGRVGSRIGLFSALCAIVVPVVLSGSANATVTTATFAPAADAYVVQNRASKNFGTDKKLNVQDAPIHRAYLRFDVRGLSGTVVSANLAVRAATTSTIPVAVRAVGDITWDEKKITYANAPDPAPTASATGRAFSAGEWVTIDVTPLVAGNGTITVALTTSNTANLAFDSREAIAAARPRLDVKTTTAVKPVNTTTPSIDGQAHEGQTLSASPGAWIGTAPLTYAYQWQRCDSAGGTCVLVAGATEQTYTASSADLGSTLRVSVTASNDLSTSATSAPTAVVAAAPPTATAPANITQPSISGSAREDETVMGDAGGWSGTTPLSLAYQWRRCDSSGAGCADIVGATAQTYVVAAADVGHTLRLLVTGSNSVGSATATSDQTPLVAAAQMPPANTTAPSISGTAQEGQTLTASPGTWSGIEPIVYTDQWRRCDSGGQNCVDIAGATAPTYAVGVVDVGSTLRVAIVALNVAGVVTAVSAPTVIVAAAAVAPANTGLPSVVGNTQEGQNLTAEPGTWTGTQPIGYAYQWRRCDVAGGTCADIVGAENATYTLKPDDVGSTIRLSVTGSNGAGSVTAVSTATAVIAADADGLTQIAASTEGSSDPTYFASNHRIALTSSGRQLVVHGVHATGVGLAWRDAGGVWRKETRGAVSNGILLGGTGTGDWPASIAVARDGGGAEHAWVVWSGPNFGAIQLVAMRRLTDLDNPAGPVVGPAVTIEAALLGDARVDIAFEVAPDGSTRGCVSWVRRAALSKWEVVASWFTDLATDEPTFGGEAVVFSSTSSANLFTSLVPSGNGIRIAARSGSSLRAYGHDRGAALTTWWSSAAGVGVNSLARPTGFVLGSGEVLVAAHDTTSTGGVVVQRFSPDGRNVVVDLDLPGYAEPTLVGEGSDVWLVMIRRSDGFVVSRNYATGVGWSTVDRTEVGAEGGGNYSWPNVLRETRGRLRLVVRGPAGSANRSSVLAYDRRL